MKLRDALLAALLALGLVPAALLCLTLMPGIVAALDSAADQTALARAETQALQLAQRLERRRETVRNIVMLPAGWEMLQAHGEVGPQLDSGQATIRFANVLRRWFNGATDVLEVAVTDRDGHERLRLRHHDGSLATVESAATAQHDLGEHYARALGGPCGTPHAMLADRRLRLFAFIKCQGQASDSVGTLILDIALDAVLAGYQDALWVDGDGRYIHGAVADGQAFQDFPALREAAPLPLVLSDANGQDIAWVPLRLDPDGEMLWVGSAVNHRDLAAWQAALKGRALLVVLPLGLAVLLAVRGLTRWLDGLRGQMLAGLRRIVDGDGMVRFDWHGPAEVVALGHELTALGSLHAAANQARQLAERQLSAEKTRAEITLRSITDGVVTLDPQGRVQFLNPAAERLIGRGCDTAAGCLLEELVQVIDGYSRQPLTLPVRLSIAEDRSIETAQDALLLRGDGSEVFIQAASAPMHDDAGGIAGAVVVLRDVTQERRLQRQLAHQASHDSLTGLANRAAFEALLAQALAEARRHGDLGLWLCYVDLDQFKMINDSCGHQAGDHLLQQVAGELKAAVRDCDTVARMGGDEFAVLLRRCPRDHALDIIDRMRRRLTESRFTWQGQSFVTSGSFGLVPIHAASGSLYDLMSAADSACYVAKERGRNRIHLADGQDEAIQQYGGEIKWAHETIRALEENRLCLYYQPIRPLKAEGGLHLEILVRMMDADGQLVPPGVFIPAAERYNLMRDVDRWVLRATLERFHDAAPGTVVAVNLSAQTLCDDEFLGFALEAIAQSGIDPRVLCFEITETSAMSNLVRAQEIIRALQAHGCRFALDDFGSGLSSFGYLKNLPINYLKIDGSFVKHILDQPLDRAFVQSMSDLGHLMGIETIAEYVENAEVEQVLREIGVDFAQGYGIAPPRPVETLAIPSAGRARALSAG